MKIVALGIVFYDFELVSDYTEKNHSYYSKVNLRVGGSIANIISLITAEKALIYKQGNCQLSKMAAEELSLQAVKLHPIPIDKQMPIFTIINQKERYTSLTDDFDFLDTKGINLEILNQYDIAITNCPRAELLNYLFKHTKCQWILNSYIPQGLNFDKLLGIIVSREEILKIYSSIEQAINDLKDKNLKFIIITLDKEGLILIKNQESYFYPVKCKNLKSRIRTGDYFTANFLNRYLLGEDINNSIEYAMEMVENFIANN